MNLFASRGRAARGRRLRDRQSRPRHGAEPRGLAVDVNDRLFVAETGADRILIYDLWSERLLRQVALPGARPTDLAAHGTRRRMRCWPPPADSCASPRRSGPDAVRRCRPAVPEAVAHRGLARAARGDPRHRPAPRRPALVPGAERERDFPSSRATDLEWESNSMLVVARQTGADFLRLRVGRRARAASVRCARAATTASASSRRRERAMAPAGGTALRPRPAESVTGPRGFSQAVPARLEVRARRPSDDVSARQRRATRPLGPAFPRRLHPRWYRCAHARIALDETDDEPTIARCRPPMSSRVTHCDPTCRRPCRRPRSFAGDGRRVAAAAPRESGRELPWTQPASDDPFRTYEAPIDAPPGRFLWLTLELAGNTRVTPRIKCLRAEHPGARLSASPAATFSREEGQAAFPAALSRDVRGLPRRDRSARRRSRHSSHSPRRAR